MTLRLKGSTSGHTEIKAPAAAGDNTITLPTSNGSAEQFLKNSGTAGELEFSSMVETSTGVGIGTSAPGVLVDAAGSNPTLRVRATTVNTEVSTLRLTEDNNYVGAYVKYDGSTNLTHIGTHSASDSNAANDNNAITIVRDDRKVGIGSSNPQSQLHVEDASATCSLSIVAGDSTSNSNIQFGDQDDINVGLISYNHTDNALSMRTSGSGTDVLLDSSGMLNVQSGDLRVTGGEGVSASLYLIADEGDDNGDGWRINSNQDVNDLTISHNSSGSYVDQISIKSTGRVGIGIGSPAGQLHVEQDSGVLPGMYLDGNNGGYSATLSYLRVSRGNNSGYDFLACQSAYTGSTDNEFTLRGDGNAYADDSWNGGGADYAEYFEWSDGNSVNEDRRGISVVLDGNKIREAVDGEEPIGVISGNPSVVGDAGWNKWSGKYLRDDYGSYVRDENGDRQLSPDFDPDVEYVPREDRPEWGCVGLMGKLRIRKGQVTGARWIKMRDVSDTVEEWLVR